MKRIRITHKTEYNYSQPVKFGTHRALMRPREGHDVHIEKGSVEIEPKASIRWLRDLHANSVAIINFEAPAKKLSIFSEVDVDLYDDSPITCMIDATARSYPFQYVASEQVGLIPYRLPAYPYDSPVLQKWLSDLYQPGQLIDTFDLLNNLNNRIYTGLKYTRR